MTTQSWLLLAAYLVVLLAAAKPLGLYMAKLMEASRWRPLARVESGVFRLCGIRDEEMSWRGYALAVLVFSLVGLLVVYGLQRGQEMAAAQSARTPRRHAGFVLQHRCQLRDQYQLAGLWR